MENLIFKKEYYGELLPFVEDNNVTDVDYNGYALWITDLEKGRYKSDVILTDKFLNDFGNHVADCVGGHFTPVDGIVEADVDGLRITVTHDKISVCGISLEIRKSLPEVRHTIDSILETKYCPLPILNLLINCVKARMNFVFCGEPGIGKTECAKFFAQFIPYEDRIITLEDNLEMHLHEIYPEKDVVELLINDRFSYEDAIAHCLRKHPKWILLSETRGAEAKYLLQQWSTGLKGFTTLHLDDLRNLPDRYMNMIGRQKDAERLENSIYEYISIGIQLRFKEGADGTKMRYIDQVAVYDRSHGENKIYMLVEDGEIKSTELPQRILWKLSREGIQKPFEADELVGYNPLDIDLNCVKEAV